MLKASELQNEVSQILSNGNQVSIRFYTVSGADAGYDDDVTLSASGSTLWTSGLVFPIKGVRGSKEAVLLEQGKLLSEDQALFVNGSITISGTFKIGIGSPSSKQYQMATPGVESYEVGGTPVYHKVYIRYLPTGSLTRE